MTPGGNESGNDIRRDHAWICNLPQPVPASRGGPARRIDRPADLPKGAVPREQGRRRSRPSRSAIRSRTTSTRSGTCAWSKITTDDGVVGWGESITQFPEANFAAKAIIEGMAERVVGKDPLENIAIWHAAARQEVVVRLQRRHRLATPSPPSTWRSGTSRASCSAPSVLNLLGGAVHERLPAVASCHAHYEDIGADGRGGPGVGRARAARRQGRLRQARQRAPRLRARPGRRVHAPDARGARARTS